jgi:hypothetical protein
LARASNGAAGGSGSAAADDSAATAAANQADAAFLMNYLESCPPRISAALKAIAADPRATLRQYARDPEVMAALGTVLARGTAPGRRAAIERLLAATADEADGKAVAGGAPTGQEQQQQQQQQSSQPSPDIPAPGKVVSAMFSDPELARLMAEPEVRAALQAARSALLSGGGDAGARAALEGRGAKVDRAMELLEARLGRFVAAPGGTLDV